MNKIEKIKTKQSLNKLKKILLKELKNPYYDDVAHVRDIVKLKESLNRDSNGNSYIHIENIVNWDNEWISFNNFNFTTPSLRMIRK